MKRYGLLTVAWTLGLMAAVAAVQLASAWWGLWWVAFEVPVFVCAVGAGSNFAKWLFVRRGAR